MFRKKKFFGQHFLHDKKIIARLVAFIAPQAGENLLEIGPGDGALTSRLLPMVGNMDVVEIDADVIPALHKKTHFSSGLRVHCMDILQVDLAQFTQPLRIVGNLPYNISTPLLFYLLNDIERINDMYFMLQKEVADRIIAVPGNKIYGRLSVMLQYYFAVSLLCHIKPGAFTPAPRVDSAFVRFVPRVKHALVAHHKERFNEVVRVVFSKRRKTILNSLKKTIPGLARYLIALNIDSHLRPEQLSVEQFVALSNLPTGFGDQSLQTYD